MPNTEGYDYRERQMQRVIDVFTKHFGTNYKTTLSEPAIMWLSIGFTAALDLVTADPDIPTLVYCRLTER